MSYLELHGVAKEIRKNQVLRNISLTIERGTVTGFRGVNGSGKTMLLRIISGLIHPTAGSVTIDGRLLGKEIEFPPSMGLLIENPAFLEQYDALENLRILNSISARKISDKELRGLVERVGLGQANGKKYRKYSLGMKQRLGLAAAVLGEPDLVLMDEPTNALDVEGIEMLRGLIGQERRRGAAVVVACHDTAFLDSVADIIYCFENGSFVGTVAPQGEDEEWG